MSYVPAPLAELRTYLAARTGLPFVSLGIVGNTAHKSGYHLGRDRIYGPDGQGDNDYSVQTARDKAGLSNAASAIDIGNFGDLRAFSIWLVAELRKGNVLGRDFREVIYSPDGTLVLRWVRGANGNVPFPMASTVLNNSHRTHSHISFDRDSETRTKLPLIALYFEGEDVNSFVVYERRAYAMAKIGAKLFASSQDAADGSNAVTVIDPARELVYVGTLSDSVRIVAYEPPGADDPNSSSVARFIRKQSLVQDAAGNVVIRFANEDTPDTPAATIVNPIVDEAKGLVSTAMIALQQGILADLDGLKL